MPPSAGGPEAKIKDASSPASKPQGTLRDQVQTMESEGQSQPQADELPPEEHGKGIPPLPEPNVEGVGNESGPSAGRGLGKLTSDKKNPANDGSRS